MAVLVTIFSVSEFNTYFYGTHNVEGIPRRNENSSGACSTGHLRQDMSNKLQFVWTLLSSYALA
jgi:hypothetical protein